MDSKIKLGDKVRDKITGLRGIVTEYYTYITGPDRCGVESEVSDTNKHEGVTMIDTERLEAIE